MLRNMIGNMLGIFCWMCWIDFGGMDLDVGWIWNRCWMNVLSGSHCLDEVTCLFALIKVDALWSYDFGMLFGDDFLDCLLVSQTDFVGQNHGTPVNHPKKTFRHSRVAFSSAKSLLKRTSIGSKTPSEYPAKAFQYQY